VSSTSPSECGFSGGCIMMANPSGTWYPVAKGGQPVFAG
jgi:hypothetical protein